CLPLLNNFYWEHRTPKSARATAMLRGLPLQIFSNSSYVSGPRDQSLPFGSGDMPQLCAETLTLDTLRSESSPS
ncbi:hypothetical protein, partial [Roseinatronobacter monicus]|uniref:hypothetical protein n=1 Tax=Roseinatronobacter monicus TaxID=393481 RepID=UPI003F339E8E